MQQYVTFNKCQLLSKYSKIFIKFSAKINEYSVIAYNQVRLYSSFANLKSSYNSLDPDFITGFVDAEGSFMLTIMSTNERRIG
jgi:hypothetical protein